MGAGNSGPDAAYTKLPFALIVGANSHPESQRAHNDSARANMSDEEKASYSYRILAALDASINAGKDFVIGKGWSPLVQLGISLELLGN